MDVSSSSPLELHLYHQIYGFPVPQYLQFQVSSVLSPQREGYHSIANGTLCRWEFTIRLCYHQKHLPLLLRLCLKIRWLLTCDRLRLSQASTSGSHWILQKRSTIYPPAAQTLLLRLCLTNFCTLHLRIFSNTQNCSSVVYISRFNLIATWIWWIGTFLLHLKKEWSQDLAV